MRTSPAQATCAEWPPAAFGSLALGAITESSLHEIRERNPGVEAEMVAFRLAAFGLSVLDPDSQRRGSHRGKLRDVVRD